MNLILIFLIFFLNSCSFDNKSGIWKNEKQVTDIISNNPFKDFKSISLKDEEQFKKTIKFDNNFDLNIFPAKNNNQWNDIFFSSNNNLINFSYYSLNELKFKSKKITRSKVNNFLLFENNNLIVNDLKGNIIIYSLKNKLILDKFNFYKKQLKKIDKKLNLIVKNNIIYVSDNLGFLYAYDYLNKKVLWAKKYQTPFRSNIKITNKFLITSSQNNELFFFDIKTGKILRSIPTEENILKNQFINNLSINENNLFYLNSFGTLYSIDLNTTQINWFVNLNKSLDLTPSNLFKGNQVISENNKVIVSSDEDTYFINSQNGIILNKKNFSSEIRPLINNNLAFFITKNNYLVAVDLNDYKILYSYDLKELIADFLNEKKRGLIFKSLLMINSRIFLILENSYFLEIEINGDLSKLEKFPTKINTQPIIINNSILFLNRSNKLAVIN